MWERFSEYKSTIGLFVLAAGIIGFPKLITNPYYLNVANIIGLNTIIVVGLNLLIGFAGQVSLGHAAFYGIGAYISAILTVTYGVPAWPALVVAALVTGSIALIIGIPTLKLRGHYLVMATLGFNIIANIIIVQCDTVTGGPSGFPGVPALSFGGWTFNTDEKMYYLIWLFAFLAILLALNLAGSRVGRGLRALHGNESAASCVGVPTKTYKVKIFVLSAVFASVAGSLYAHYLSFVSPKTFDIFFSVELVTMAIVGGMGSIWGCLFGAAFLTSLPNVLHAFDEYKDIFYGLILVVILLFVPEGLIVGVAQRWRTSRTARPKDGPGLETYQRESQDQTPPYEKRSALVSLASPVQLASCEPILRIQNVFRGFGGVMAVSDVSFEIPSGAITAMIGPNGAGKTTIINLICGVYRPSHGTILFQDRSIERLQPYQIARLGLARTFQNLQIFDNMTVLENVMVGLHAKTRNEFLVSMLHLPAFKREETKIRQRAMDALAFFNLENHADIPASQLSFGQQKRLEMARALAPSPQLILLDEPVAGLNMTESLEIAELILRMRSQGISVLLVEHDINVVMRISDKVVVLNYGIKIAEGTPHEVQTNEDVLSAYLGGAA